jgi:hypothetical protein
LEERKLELLGEGTRRWDLIRSGTYAERAIAVQQEMAATINDIKTLGYHHFANGNDFPAYIWIKKVALTNPLTYDCAATDTLTNPAAYPAWRGQYNYSANATVASKVVGTTHNVAIQGCSAILTLPVQKLLLYKPMVILKLTGELIWPRLLPCTKETFFRA